MAARSRTNCCASACTRRASSLAGGPTAKRSVVGGEEIYNAAPAIPINRKTLNGTTNQACRIVIERRARWLRPFTGPLASSPIESGAKMR